MSFQFHTKNGNIVDKNLGPKSNSSVAVRSLWGGINVKGNYWVGFYKVGCMLGLSAIGMPTFTLSSHKEKVRWVND